MKNSHDQLKTEYTKTDKESNSVRLICIFLILIFALIPLAEIVTDFDYYNISHQSTTHFCGSDWGSFEPLSFKEIK